MKPSRSAVFLAVLACCAGTAQAQSLGQSLSIYTYPANGQAGEQQSKDDYECFSWAQQQTGYDPMKPPQAQTQTASQQAPTGSRLRGAARGAAAGAIIGEVADDDAGDGAAIGATLGALRGGSQDRQRRQQQAQQANQAAEAQVGAAEDAFRNAYGACMQGRGYTVSF
ncbi:MAG: YMGG-like glycine zipper-containing protein [Pseudomonadales bacterium]|jgi:hypothetical protein|nr:YMGG-like glycine zipper-containing protein [Pseudomonadales bacterium]